MEDQICNICNNKNNCDLREITEYLDHQILNCKNFKDSSSIMVRE
jgi:hypothetical protein